MKKIFFIISIMSILLLSCESKDLGGGYSYGENPEYGDNLILNRTDTTLYHYWSSNDSSLKEGALVKFHRVNQIDTFFIWDGAPVISAHINKVSYDSVFIIVDQKPLDSIWGKYITINNLRLRPRKPDHGESVIKSLKESNYHMYWIIDKRTDDIYGPMNWNEYKKRRTELGVPKELRLYKK